MPDPHHRLVVGVVAGSVAFAALMAGSMAGLGLLVGPAAHTLPGRGDGEPVKGPESAESPGVDETSLRAAVTQAAKRTIGRGSTRVRLTVEVTAQGGPFVVTADGSVDGRSGEARLELDVPGTSDPLRQVVTPDGVYVRTPKIEGAPPSWVQTDGGNLLVAGGALTAADPAAVVGTLLGASDGVALDGTARVDGRRTIVYVGEANLRDAAARLPPRERRTLTAALPLVRDASVPFTAFIDRRGRLLRLEETVSMSTNQLGSLVARIHLAFSGFGAKVRVKVPAPRRVSDELAQSSTRNR